MLRDARMSGLFIHTFDLERMVGFYRDVLGLEVYFEVPGQCAFFRTGGGRGPSLALYGGRDDSCASAKCSQSHWFVMFDVPELDGVVRDLGARGVAVGPIEAVPYGRMAKLEDPEGNVLEVHQPDSARGEGEAT